MEPASYILISAFVAGTAKGAAQVGEKAINDAYMAFRHLVVSAYGKAGQLFQALTAFENNPRSEGRRTVLAEELKDVKAHDNQPLVSAANAVLRAAENASHPVGIEWEKIKAARILLGEINVANGTGIKAVEVDAQDIVIPKINVGVPNRGN